MKAIQMLTAIFISAALMGCQIEVTPLEEEQINGQPVAEIDETENKDSATVIEEEIVEEETEAEEETPNSTVTLYWSAPIERMNGSNITHSDIGGYEIRYKKDSETQYTTVLITDASIEQHSIEDLDDASSYEFEVAVFDTNGLYSDFTIASN